MRGGGVHGQGFIPLIPLGACCSCSPDFFAHAIAGLEAHRARYARHMPLLPGAIPPRLCYVMSGTDMHSAAARSFQASLLPRRCYAPAMRCPVLAHRLLACYATSGTDVAPLCEYWQRYSICGALSAVEIAQYQLRASSLRACM